MTVLVTGGAGYIGSHTSVELLNSGIDIVIIDNFSISQEAVIQRIKEITGKKFKYYKINLVNRKDIEAVFLENKIDSVIHFAGLKAVGESVSFPLDYYNNNIVGTINLCETMVKFGIKKIVFSSSATVYGVPDKVPITEDSSLGPVTNPYGRTKLMIEEILKDTYLSDPEWSIALLRYFNPVGAHISGRIGEDPKGVPNNLMPYITQVAIGKRTELQVYGKDYGTIDGTGVRDYIHVVDLAKGHLAALSKVTNSTGLETYNLGTGRGYSVLEIVAVFEKITGVKIPYQVVDRRQGDVAICFADVSKAYKEIGWKAEKEIEEMCLDAWRWQKMNPHGYEKNIN